MAPAVTGAFSCPVAVAQKSGAAMRLEISCAFATSLDTPEHVAVAERLGYRRAWCYDSPALYPDVWIPSPAPLSARAASSSAPACSCPTCGTS